MNLDMANAFGTSTWESLEETNEDIFLEDDWEFAEQRLHRSAAELPSSSTPLVTRPRGGALMGDQYAVKSFLHNYETPSQDWNATGVVRRAAEEKEDAAFFHC